MNLEWIHCRQSQIICLLKRQKTSLSSGTEQVRIQALSTISMPLKSAASLETRSVWEPGPWDPGPEEKRTSCRIKESSVLAKLKKKKKKGWKGGESSRPFFTQPGHTQEHALVFKTTREFAAAKRVKKFRPKYTHKRSQYITVLKISSSISIVLIVATKNNSKH